MIIFRVEQTVEHALNEVGGGEFLCVEVAHPALDVNILHIFREMYEIKTENVISLIENVISLIQNVTKLTRSRHLGMCCNMRFRCALCYTRTSQPLLF